MKLLVIAQRVPFPPNKGEKLRTYHQIEWLRQQGYTVEVAAPTASAQDEADLQALAQHLGVGVHGAPLQAKPWRMLLGLAKGISLSEANFASVGLREQVANILSRGDVNYILLSASSLLPYAQPAIEQNICPVLMDFMDLDSDKWQQYSERAGWPMRWLYQREALKVARLEHQAAMQCKACFFIAQAEIDLFHQKMPQAPVFSLGNGIDREAFYPAEHGLRENCAQDPVLLFVGAMDYTPNVDAMCWLVESGWSKIRANHPGAKLIIAGMNPNAAVQALGKVEGVEVTGFVEDILPYFHQADLFIAPFRLARGVQNKVLQAFACGLPTVTTPMGVEGIACEAQTHYRPAHTMDDFVEQVHALAGDFAQRKALGQAACALIRDQYSWEAQLSVLKVHLTEA